MKGRSAAESESGDGILSGDDTEQVDDDEYNSVRESFPHNGSNLSIDQANEDNYEKLVP
jgi:hypothetical protein